MRIRIVGRGMPMDPVARRLIWSMVHDGFDRLGSIDQVDVVLSDVPGTMGSVQNCRVVVRIPGRADIAIDQARSGILSTAAYAIDQARREVRQPAPTFAGDPRRPGRPLPNGLLEASPAVEA
jgi:hypothetical protein